jgi:hypothetical protein
LTIKLQNLNVPEAIAIFMKTIIFTDKERRSSMEQQTYMTTEELANRLRYDARYIRSALKDAVFIEGIHYIRPFGRRRVLYIWESIERDMVKVSMGQKPGIPMAGGGVCYG